MTAPHLRVPAALALAALAAAAAPRAAAGQDGRPPVTVNSEAETYLRVLQVAGKVPAYPWSLRGFSPAEVDRLAPVDSAHPWAARHALRPDTAAGTRIEAVDPELRVVHNTAFPYGFNDGAVWAGRGATMSLQGGATVRRGGLSLTVAPVLSVAANRGFTLAFNGFFDERRYADQRSWDAIDLPQRFGSGTRVALDPGQSQLRLDLGPLAIGGGTANQHWGPAADHPLVLGNNAAGFPHAFVGTSRPLDVWVGRVHGRLVYGRLTQSDWAVIPSDSAVRFMSGIVMVFTPRGVPGLEIGGSRFFHESWPDGGPGWDNLSKPLEGLLKNSLRAGEGDDGSRPDNQVASVFFRWVAPRAGLEVWGEYGKEDHNRDFRQFFLEMDNGRGYAFGARRVWAARDGRTLTAVRAEVMNTLPPNINLVLPQARWNTHRVQRQGHTFEGQLLGSAAGAGGGATVVAVDRYTPRGRMTVRWDRMLRNERHSVGPDDDRGIDVVHALGAEGVFFAGRMDLTAGVRWMRNYNRDFLSDRSNLNLTLGARAAL